MTQLLCYGLLFFSISQPGSIFPALETYRVFFVMAALAVLLSFLLPPEAGPSPQPIRLPQKKYLFGMLLAYTLSEVQYFWLGGTLEVFLFWFKKIILFFVVVRVATRLEDLQRLMWGLVWAVATLTWFGWDLYWHDPSALINAGRLQSVGNYDLSNSFALLLACTFPVAYALLEVQRGALKRLILLLFLAVLVVSCLYTKSRGGSFGMLAGVGLSLALSSRLVRGKALKAAAAGLVILLFSTYGLAIILNRTDATSYFGGGGEASSGDRLLAWRAALGMVRDHPLFGVGWQKFPEFVTEYGHDKRILAHNTLLSVLAETGLVGFGCFVGILFHTLRQLWTVRARWRGGGGHEELSLLAQGLLIALVCFMINTTFSVKDHDPLFWALLTLSSVLYAIHQRTEAALAPAVGGDGVTNGARAMGDIAAAALNRAPRERGLPRAIGRRPAACGRVPIDGRAD